MRLFPVSRARLVDRAGWLCAGSLLVSAPSAAASQDIAQSQDGNEITASADEEIVVTAPKGDWGAARVAPRSTIGAPEIERFAADTIDDLVGRLAARTGALQPAVLVNGERAEGVGIGSYPPEAIERIEVLPPDAAALYGYEPGRQLLNIILRRRFDNFAFVGTARGATQGGGGNYEAYVQHLRIAGQVRRRIRIDVKASDRLLEADRDIPVPALAASLAGRVSAPVPGDEIDPALSALAGFPVLSADIAVGQSGTPSLADFLPLGSDAAGVDESRYRSILPATRSLALAAEIGAPIGSFQSSLLLGADYRTSTSLLGLPAASLLAAASNPWSPFADDVIIDRAWDSGGALSARQQQFGASVTAGINGRTGGWQLGASTRYNFTFLRSRTDRGVDLAAIDAGVASGTLNPFALALPALLIDERRTTTHNAELQFNASRMLAKLPTGPVNLALSGGATANRAVTRIPDGADYVVGRSSASARAVLDATLNSPGEGPVPALGRIGIQLAAGGDIARGEAARTQYSSSLFWMPTMAVGINLIIRRAVTPPTADLLNAPLVETPNVRTFDFVAGERVDVLRLTGGNPALRDAKLDAMEIRVSLHPPSLAGLSVTTSFRRERVRDAIGQLPALTAAVERAFPDRIVRDGAGRLVGVDARPINIASSLRKNIDTNFFWMTGAIPTDDEPPGAMRPAAADDAARSQPLDLGFTLGLLHSWNLVDRAVLREGLPALDRLEGDSGTSAPRHSVTATGQLVVGGAGGVELGVRWTSPTVARSEGAGGAPGTRIDFSSKTEVDMRAFVNPDRLTGARWAKRLRLIVDIINLFDKRVSAFDQDGNIPFGFTRDEIDPLGRTVKLTVRKLI